MIEAHAWFVTWFLCLIALAALLEGLNLKKSLLELLPALGTMFIVIVIGWFAVKRYGLLLRQAEHFAQRSTCGACRAYGTFEVVEPCSADMRVRCRKCGHEWRI